MTGSLLNKFVVTPAIISAAVFGVLALPLAMLGQKPLTIQLQDEPVFHGQLRDVAMPYLGLATVLSLAAGTASVAVTGWRDSSRKSAEAEAQLSDLAQNLKQKEELLESLKLSNTRLEASGLNSFLDEELESELAASLEENVTPEPTPSLEEKVIPEPATQPSYSRSDESPVAEPFEVKIQSVSTQTATPSPTKVQSAAAKFASAQTYMAYAPRKVAVEPLTMTSLPPSEVEKLQSQLEQIKAQMGFLHKALAAQQVDGSANPTPLRVIKHVS